MACCFAVQLVMGVSSARVLREEASSSRRSFEDQVRLPLARGLILQRARSIRPRLIAHRLGVRVGVARKQVSASLPPNLPEEVFFLAGYGMPEPHACPPYHLQRPDNSSPLSPRLSRSTLRNVAADPALRQVTPAGVERVAWPEVGVQRQFEHARQITRVSLPARPPP